MGLTGSVGEQILIIAFIVTQLLYLATFLIDGYIFSRPVNRVDMADAQRLAPATLPQIVLLYPVLNELEATMRSTFLALRDIDYPQGRYRVVAVPNANDSDTIAALRRLQGEFAFLEVLEVPPTTDGSWQVVWSAWDANPHAYWWHKGARAGERALPPKKTRQLIYAFYTIAQSAGGSDFLVNYIDADSVPPRDHFMAGAAGMQRYDVLQSTNVAGNLLASLPAAWHAFDHMTWDGRKYAHLSADGRHPYWVLGKGLFFRASDLLELGGFHPWITIEDPEVGMRFWKNGRRLGVIEGALVEEVPDTFAKGIRQRKRWVAGFFQSLGEPLDRMGFTRGEKVKAWLNFIPCLSLWINAIGIPVGIWAIVKFAQGDSPLPLWTVILAGINVTLYAVSLVLLYTATWRRTALVLARRRDRLAYMALINPLFLFVWWLLWVVPLLIGWMMYRRDSGLVWERTEKIDANAALVRERHPRAASITPTTRS